MLKNILEEAGKYNFISIENFNDFGEKLLEFLRENYKEPRGPDCDSFKIIFKADYLQWLFSKGGFLGVLRYGEEWVGVASCPLKKMRYKTVTRDIFTVGQICIKEGFKSLKNLKSLLVFCGNIMNKTYGLPGMGPGVPMLPFRKAPMSTIFGNCRIGFAQKGMLSPPENKIFSHYNFHLEDEKSSFLDRYSDENGWVSCYPQEIQYQNRAWNVGIITSYSTSGSWNELIYNACTNQFLEKYDLVFIYENYERNFNSLQELGFYRMNDYSIYSYSDSLLPSYFLYYNFFIL
jgi:hypothetical protein